MSPLHAFCKCEMIINVAAMTANLYMTGHVNTRKLYLHFSHLKKSSTQISFVSFEVLFLL